MKPQNSLPEPTKWLAFLDETGNPSLTKIDPDFPIFGLATVVCERMLYLKNISVEVSLLKHRFFGHEGIILHSYDIRKQQKDFKILHHQETRESFIPALTEMVDTAQFCLFFTAIQKQKHLDRYGQQAAHPYELALEFTLERLFYFCREHSVRKLPLIAERRGKKEDDALRLHFHRVLSQGTRYISASDLSGCRFTLDFATKKTNVVGLQLADLCAYPLARHVASDYSGPDFQVVSKKLHTVGNKCPGWKIFP